MSHFLSDNTSPEVFSFYTARLNGSGRADTGAAAETAKRFLFCQLLIAYANLKFDLISNHQKVEIYFSPHPPLQQKMLNSIISDASYRELFMSPCLSGWACGEAKYRYMVLCHQVLSRSQLNAVKKLKEANIIRHDAADLIQLLDMLDECMDSPGELDTPRKFFERKIKYWLNRPMPEETDTVAAPADSKMLVGSFAETSHRRSDPSENKTDPRSGPPVTPCRSPRQP